MAAIKLYTNTIKGYIDITGNTLGLAGSDSSIKGGVRNFTTLAEGTTTTFALNGSNSYLSIPTGGTVLHAQLFWSGAYRNTTFSKDVSSSINNSINFTDPKGTITAITRNATNSQTMTTGTDYYANCADVTSLVKTGGSGYYSVSNVPGILVDSGGSPGDGDNWYLGWTLILAIADQTQPYRNMNIWAICDADTNSTTGVINISGFATGTAGPFDGKLFISAGCGNSSLTGDSLQFGTSTSSLTSLSTTVHPSTNFFCGVISNRSGALQTLGTFGTKNNTAGSVPTSGNRSMYDITGVDMSSTLTVSQTTGVIRIYSTGDGIVANSLAAEIRMNDVANLAQNFNCTVDKNYAIPGEVLTYTISVKNTGLTSAKNVVFVNTIPAEATYVSDSLYVDGTKIVGGNPAGPNGVNIGNMVVNAIKTITFKITVITIPSNGTIKNDSGAGYSFSPAVTLSDINVFDTSQVATTTINVANILVSKKASEYAIVGDTINYTISLSNIGNISANNVTIYDTIPAYTSFVTNSLVVNAITQNGANPNSGFNIGTIPVGNATVTFKVIVTTIPILNPISNSARISYSFTKDPSIPNGISNNINTNIVTTTVNQVYLSSKKYADSDFINAGETITFTLTFNNTGNTTADNVTIINGIPNGTTFIENSLKTNEVIDTVINPSLGLNAGTIQMGLSTVTYKVRVTTLPSAYTLVNTATISYYFSRDPRIQNEIGNTINLNSTVTTINYAQITSTQKTDLQYVGRGDILTYTLEINNIGIIDANNVTISGTIPNGTRFVDNSLDWNGINIPYATPISYNLGTISPNKIQIVSYKVEVITIPSTSSISNSSTISYNVLMNPSIPVNQSISINTPIISNSFKYPILSISKSINRDYFTTGEIATYTVVVNNSGGVTAKNIILQDSIPDETTFITNSVYINGVVTTSAPSYLNIGNVVVGGRSTVTFKVKINS